MKKVDEVLFFLEGKPVHYGDILWHPDPRNVGWYCVAEFKADGDTVTVRSPNGAVPTVEINDLRWEQPQYPRCKTCGQLLPIRKGAYYD